MRQPDGIGRALAEADDQREPPQLLAAYVEVMLAVGDVPAARQPATSWRQAARSLGSADARRCV